MKQHLSLEESQGIWDKASEILKEVFPSEWEDMTTWKYPDDLPRMAGAWAGCAVNIGSAGKPVQTRIHRDIGESPFAISCLTAFGDYTGADVELWELELQVQLKPGDLLFFADSLIHHSNTTVTGRRHSCVAFTPKNMFDWFKREYNRSTEKEDELRKRRKTFEISLNKATKTRAKKLTEAALMAPEVAQEDAGTHWKGVDGQLKRKRTGSRGRKGKSKYYQKKKILASIK